MKYTRVLVILAGLTILFCLVAYGLWAADVKTEIHDERPRNEAFLEQKEKWRKHFSTQSAQSAYEQIITEITNQKSSEHEHTHILGELLYEEYHMEGLGECDGSFGFGCYHGFFNAAIYAEGIEILPELDAACKKKYGLVDTRCQHGLGHGLLVYTGYENLTDALMWCTTISTQPTGSCTGGVFMEYNFHTMEMPLGDYYRPMEDEDPHAPCMSLPEQFRASCYQEQPLWWAKHFDNDYKKMGMLCAELPAHTPHSDSCFMGVGNAISEKSLYEYTEVISQCGTMPEEYAQALCREGASWQFIGREGEDRDAYILLCESLDQQRRDACMNMLDAW